jgi:hypothetical protein
MHDLATGNEGGMPTRREFGRFLAAAMVVPVSLPDLRAASPSGSVTDQLGAVFVPDDTYPFFADVDLAQHAEPSAAAGGGGKQAFRGS